MKSSTITVTDMFCGAGGSSTGAVQAGADVKLAINHWARAIETHNTNHPNTTHVLTDITRADPWRYPATTILVASPECTNHTLAKGKQRRGLANVALPGFGDVAYDPAEERSRCTMFDPLRWTECHGYEMVILENVVDARSWVMWDAWLHAWDNLGYNHEIVYLNSMFAHPTPQSRDRMYFVAWKRGNHKPDLSIRPLAHCPKCARDVEAVQCWKNPTKRSGKYKQQYVYLCSEHACEVQPYFYPAASAIDWSRPIQRISERKSPLKPKTMERVKDGLEKFVQRPFLIDHIAEYRPRSIQQPMSTIVGGGNHQSLIIPPAWLMSYYGNGAFASVEEPVPTVTTLDRCALVTQQPEAPRVEECGFRMLEPHEIQAAMAFPKSYVVTGTRREKVKQLGNAVTPPVMELLIGRAMAALGSKEQAA